jgi:hypothetical protein
VQEGRRRLTGPGRWWRLGAVVLGFAGLAYGTTIGSDYHFPVGPLSQYAGRIDSTGGEVVSTYVTAEIEVPSYQVTEPGGPGPVAEVDVQLKQTKVGLGRADIEGHVGDIVQNPSMLQALARAQRELQPNAIPYRKLFLKQDTQHLENGRAVGPKTTKVLATWVVR